MSSRKSSKKSKSKTLKRREFVNHTTELSGDMGILGRKYATDKITHHGYHRFYPRFLEHYRSLSNCAMLEIGVENQYSIQMWLDYFPEVFIYGMDIGVNAQGNRFKIFKADQSSFAQLESVKKQINKPVFFIIDDGSHIPEHQLLTFDNYFDTLLECGGTYIIEDIETSYWTHNMLYGYPTKYGYHHPQSILEVFKMVVDDINNEYLHVTNKRTQTKIMQSFMKPTTRQWIQSVTFGQNCVVIIKKTAEEKRMFDNRKYRFQNNL